MSKKVSAPKLAIVGSESLLGRELRDLLSNQRLAEQVEFVSDVEVDPDSGENDELPILLPLSRESLSDARVIFLAGIRASSLKVRQMKLRTTLVDIAGNLNGMLRAPAAEPDRYLSPESDVLTVAHPAAIALGIFFRKVAGVSPVLTSVVNVFEPASQRGKQAVEELQEQTIGLLSFRSLPRAIFDEQASFNLLPRLGENAPDPLSAAQTRIENDLRHLLSLDQCAPPPSLRLIHAPVFHCYAMSIWVEFESEPDLEAMTQALQSPQFEIRTPDQEPPTNVGVAGQSGLSLDSIYPDPRNPRAAWFWVVCDNVRLSAENALLTAASVLEQVSRGVQ